MSAYKTATIRLGESEYQRLREAEEQLRLLTLQNRDSRRHNSTQQADSIYNRMLNDQRKRDKAFQSFQSGLSDEIGEFEKRTHRMMQDQVEKLQKRIESTNYSSLDQIQNHVDHWLVNIQNQISIQEQSLKQAWEHQDQRLAEIENHDRNLADYAVDWIHRTEEILNLIQDQYEPGIEEANELAYQKQSLEHAIQQYQSGIYELSAMVAFQTYMQSSRLRSKLEAFENAQSIKIKALESLALSVTDQIRENTIAYAMDNEGNLLDDTLDVDYWTEGRYSEIVTVAEQLHNQMLHQSRFDEDLIMSYENAFKVIQDQSIELVTQARMTVLASQLRFNVAQIVVSALESQGFYLEHASYQQGDFRDSFIATTRNFSGNEVVVTLDPDIELEEGGKLQIVSTDADQITQHELVQRNQEIFSAIESQGVSVADVQSFSELPTTLTRDKVHALHRKAMRLPDLLEKH